MDHPQRRPAGGVGPCQLQVGDGVGVAALTVVDDASVERGIRKHPIERQRPAVIGEGLVKLAECLVSQGPVIVTFGRLGGERDTDAEGIDRQVKLPEPIGAQSLVEVQPEVLWPEIQAQLELLGSELELSGSQVGPPQIIMLPGRPWLDPGEGVRVGQP